MRSATCILAVSFTALLATGCAHRGGYQLSLPPHLVESMRAEVDYKRFSGALKMDRQLLKERIESEQPALLSKLDPPPPVPLVYGYQLLEELETNDLAALRSKKREGLTVAAYSWPLTRTFIAEQLAAVEKLRARIEDRENHHDPLEKLVGAYHDLRVQAQNIEASIHYNKLWQDRVARDRANMDRQNRLLERLRAKAPREQIEQLSEPFEKSYARFYRVRGAGTPEVIVDVRAYTDIADKRFAHGLRRAIEKFWAVNDESSGTRYRVRLLLSRLTPRELYRGAKPPARGDQLDVATHARHFPKDGVVFTTGSATTYASATPEGIPYVAIAPRTAEIVLAHEFGHLLGFRDGYVRGYTDLKADGFAILEAVPDHSDLMHAPGEGLVQPHHFETILTNRGTLIR